jgi:hypothetical protein
MLTIVEPSERGPSLGHCVLEHVSLEDLTSEFARFLSDGNKPFDFTSLKNWLDRSIPEDAYNDRKQYDIQRSEELRSLITETNTLVDAKAGMKFWIDAFCINQSNTIERNHQVKLMKDIYTKHSR